MLADITAALSRGDLAAAVAAANAAIAAEPENAQAHHLLGLALLRGGDRDGARSALDHALALMPDHVMFYITRAVIGLSPWEDVSSLAPSSGLTKDHVPGAIAGLLLLLVQGRNADAEAWLVRLQSFDASAPAVKLAEGHVLQLRGQAARALRCFREAAEGDVGNALAQVSLGLANLQHGQYALAEQALRAAAVIEPGNAGVERALVEVCRRQGRQQEAIAQLDKVLSMGESSTLRIMRAKLCVESGDVEAAQVDLQQVLDGYPSNTIALPLAVDVLQRLGRPREALLLVERALAVTDSDVAWGLLLRLADGHGEHRDVLTRWAEAMPDSALCLSQLARWHERAGELERACALAEAALVKNPGLVDAELVLLRADMVTNAESVLRRIERIRPSESDAGARRSLLAFRGLAFDRLGRYAEALTDWSRMSMIISATYPLPMPEPAEDVPKGCIEGRLLWAPPGVVMESILAAVAKVEPDRLLAERAHMPQRRDDGFGVRRFQPGHENAGSAKRWLAALQVQSRDAEHAIDWMPHIDAYTLAALRGAHLVACVVDPRDALINWMVFGSTAGYVFLPDPKQDADWMALCLEALVDHRDSSPLAVTLLHLDGLMDEAGHVAAQLETALALTTPIDPRQLAVSSGPSPNFPVRFPSGHWRHYRQLLAEEFARLAPVAQRLGYPAD